MRFAGDTTVLHWGPRKHKLDSLISLYVDGLVHDYDIPNTNTFRMPQNCTNPTIYLLIDQEGRIVCNFLVSLSLDRNPDGLAQDW